jgi:uncharacterized protein YjbJ (UPF0337 family)
MAIPNKDGIENAAPQVGGSFKENVGQTANDEVPEREGETDQITDKSPKYFGTPIHKSGNAAEDADNNRRTRPPARIF